MKKGIKGWPRRIFIFAVWLVLWQLLSVLVDNSILMVGPIEAGKAFLSFLPDMVFWRTVCFSLLRIGSGFFAGLLLGFLLAAGSSRFGFLEEFLAPVITALKSIPVASFAVILLIWWGSAFLSVAVSFLIVLPNIYINTLEGLKNTDKQLLEMSEVFRMPFVNKFFYIYRPSLKPFLDSSLKISLGMSWKSGVAAEVIGTPPYSMGEGLYMSKIYLDTPGVFAWTAAIILLSFLFEKIIFFIWNRFHKWGPACRPAKGVKQHHRIGESGQRTGQIGEPIAGQAAVRFGFSRVSKEYEGRTVLKEVTENYEEGGIFLFTSPSGSGKTTALRLLAGLEKADKGEVIREGTISMMFQEDRLCEDYSALCNVELVTGNKERAARHLEFLLPKEELTKPCGQLSGGMKRRVALVRAMAANSQAVFLDEPFTGLDEENQRKAISYIRQEKRGRTLLVATHNLEAGKALAKEYTQSSC